MLVQMDGVPSFREEGDPDYSTVDEGSTRGNANLSLQQQDAREQATQKIEKIIQQQFAFEMSLKEREIEMIDERINQAKVMLDRLRACILAKYYGTPEFDRSKTSIIRAKSMKINKEIQMNKEKNGERRSNSPQNLFGLGRITKQENVFAQSANQLAKLSLENKKQLDRASVLKSTLDENVTAKEKISTTDDLNTEVKGLEPGGHVREPEIFQNLSDSRFYIKKQIIVGNTSKYIPFEKREQNDRSTHKWMVYVRGPPEEPHLDKFIKKVWFFLHPSYQPNDIVEVSKQPFHLTRRGWGEFPVRVQLHFLDPRNKRVDIIHELKLDRTYTGLQTLGAETVVDLQLDKRTFPEYSSLVTGAVTKSNETQGNAEAVTDSGICGSESIHKLKRKNDCISDEQFDVNPVLEPGAYKHLNLKKLKLETFANVSAQSSINTPISSLASSRCASPEPEPKNVFCQGYSDEHEKCLQLSVRMHPLINPSRDISVSSYAATSLEQFLKWNTGKQRACELQRALAMKRHILKVLPSCALTTKDVLVWCRQYAYTPGDGLPVGSNDSFCIICGRLVVTIAENEHDHDKPIKANQHSCHHEGCLIEEQFHNSLSNCNKFLSTIEERQQSLPQLAPVDDDDNDVEIDVVAVKSEQKAKPSSATDWLPQSGEQRWVQSVAGEIGTTLQSISVDGVHSCILEEMILCGCQQLINEIIRKASACASEQSSPFCPKLLLPLHIHKAVVSLPHCDFLTNSSLGILVEKS